MGPPAGPHVFKLVLLGSESVGKSSLALRYVRNDFRSILPTVGCAFLTKELAVGPAAVRLEIWDTAGQEKYHSVCRLYFRGAHAAVLVYDVARKDSLEQARRWLQELRQETGPEDVLVMLVGNKADLGPEREVTVQEGQGLAESQGLLFSEASALRGNGVAELFSAVAQELLRREQQKEDAGPRGDARLPLDGRPARQCCAR
ncbi:ras-related protein Rab-17 isoform X2 [Sorex fumeus]|uniref:ras-related protein Rab-17 isoform X2 n=1 Tax=Sorex fumeus TaxID=62283 RepID=UPI0024AE0110|nr:ras-related protein Rab-17 isoform X2 [Sorex fumeus]